MTAFWATVVKVELTDIVFAIDSILVAVAMSPKLWVILSGGILGIVMMRPGIGGLFSLLWRFPPLTRGGGDSRFYGADYRPWFRLDEQRHDVPLSEIAPVLQGAVLAIED